MSRLFITIPVLNEAANIVPLLDGLRVQLEGSDYLILLVDDGSTDGTIELIHDATVRSAGRVRCLHRRRERPGCQRCAAVLAGLAWGLSHTDRDVFIEMDGDLSHRPEEIHEGVRKIVDGSADVVIASKYLQGSRVIDRQLGRRLLSRAGSFTARLLIDRRVSDYTNGYRFYTRRAAEAILHHPIRYSSPISLVEALSIWMSNQFRVGEFPSTYVGRHEGASKQMWRDLLVASVGVVDVALRYHFRGFVDVAAGSAVAPGTVIAGSKDRAK